MSIRPRPIGLVVPIVLLCLAVPPARADVTIAGSQADVSADTTDFFVLPGKTTTIHTSPFTTFDQTATATAVGHAGVTRTASAQQKTTILAGGDALTLTSTGGFSIEHRGPDSTQVQNIISNASTSFSVQFCTTQRSVFRIAASSAIEAPGGTFKSGPFEHSFASGFVSLTAPNGGERVLAGLHVDPPRPTSDVVNETGELVDPGCYDVHLLLSLQFTSPLVCKPRLVFCEPPDTPANNPPAARGSYRLELDVAPAGPAGNVFAWVGPPAGGFGDDHNWDPIGVPAFVADARSDTALFRGVHGAQVDIDALANLAALALPPGRSATVPGCAGPITRTIGSLLLDASRDIALTNGALALDGVSVLPALTLQNKGFLSLSDATLCTRDAVVGATERPSFLAVSGPGGVLQTRERFSIGLDGEGTLSVHDGGIATSEEVRIGDDQETGFANVSNATWHTGNVAVGFTSPGELTIEHAGLVESEQGFVQRDLRTAPFAQFGDDPLARCLGRSAGSGVEVRGNLSTWRLNHLEIGGGGCVEVRDHGLLDAGAGGGELGEVLIATSTFGEATLAIDDASVNAAGGMIVGDRGRGHLQIVDHDLGHTSVHTADLVIGRSLPGDVDGGHGDVSVRGDVFNEDDLLASDTLVVADGDLSLGRLAILPRAKVVTATTARVGTDGGIALVDITGDPTAADPETKTRWTIGTALAVGGQGVGIPNGSVAVADAAIDVGTQAAPGQLTIHSDGLVEGTGAKINLIDLHGGLVRNDGEIRGPLLIDGVYDGASTGRLVTRDGRLAIGSRSASRVEADTPDAGAGARAKLPPPPPQGAVTVTGDADFSGTTLVLQFLNGAAPHQGDTIRVVDVGGSVTHGFAAVAITGLAPGAAFAVDAATGFATALNDTVALPTVTIAAKATLKESQAKGLKVKLTRTGPKDIALAVHYRVGGSARSGLDFGTLPGVLEIPIKKKSATFAIRPIADGFLEPPETIELEIVPGDDYAPSLASSATITLLSNEKKPKKR